MVQALFQQMAVILLLTATGYALRKASILNDTIQGGLSALVINAAIPATILLSAEQPLEKERFPLLAMIFFGSLAYHLLAIVLGNLTGRLLRLDEKKSAIFTLLTAFTNVAFIGYPIISVFLPETGIFYATFFIIGFNLTFYTYGILRVAGRESLSLRSVLTGMPMLASFAMIALYLLQIPLPGFLRSTLGLLGGMSTPLSMLVVGSMLAGFRLRELFTSRTVYLMSLLRLVVLPTLVFALVRLLRLPTEAATVLLVFSALPSGATTPIVAKLYRCEPEFATQGVLQSTLLFVASLPYVAWLAGFL